MKYDLEPPQNNSLLIIIYYMRRKYYFSKRSLTDISVYNISQKMFQRKCDFERNHIWNLSILKCHSPKFAKLWLCLWFCCDVIVSLFYLKFIIKMRQFSRISTSEINTFHEDIHFKLQIKGKNSPGWYGDIVIWPDKKEKSLYSKSRFAPHIMDKFLIKKPDFYMFLNPSNMRSRQF